MNLSPTKPDCNTECKGADQHNLTVKDNSKTKQHRQCPWLMQEDDTFFLCKTAAVPMVGAGRWYFFPV
jgi:hypothetical protein